MTTYTLSQSNGVFTFTPVSSLLIPLEPAIPSNALIANLLSSTRLWDNNHDPGTPGSSTGTTELTTYLGNIARRFDFTLTGIGSGHIYHTVAVPDAHLYSNFVYETCEFSPDLSNIGEFEKDLEFCGPDGTVHDMATQISHNVIEITENHSWTKTANTVPVRQSNMWHTTRSHVKCNSDGTITYIGYSFDNVYYPIGITTTNTDTDKWGANLLNVQLQYDGLAVGPLITTIYINKFNIYCW